MELLYNDSDIPTYLHYNGNGTNPDLTLASADIADDVERELLETINTRFPPEEWLHIYTDGSPLDFAQGAGIGVLVTSSPFYAGPLTTHFDVTSPICVLCDTGQDMTAAHLDECSALNDLNCIVK
ncbi:hypothetical protein TNCV_2709891, partial [Trichonephila clavipes]